MRLALAAVLAFTAAAPAAAQTAPALTLAEARASTAGAWEGQLQYRDYQSGEWQGIPMTVTVSLEGDGNTLTRRAIFDDGPRVGNVFITSLEMLGPDGATEYATSFRAGRVPELGKATLSLAAATDTAHWTILAIEEGTDDDRPARIRLTTTRDGASLVTLKEVDFLDDAGEAWLTRNRTVLTRKAG
ncbi:hypothetical protein [Erythrobacter sp. CCH5-A1]|jgi:hypothetical protein|uniref:hypothetical protein n=1 Tax=Erythrobacter sp. CCH5-A1 TaxID=1768792 RepID=UPI0008342019|nr:hypothetical protein [Erythrobacter sp. CCH5-A1]